MSAYCDWETERNCTAVRNTRAITFAYDYVLSKLTIYGKCHDVKVSGRVDTAKETPNNEGATFVGRKRGVFLPRFPFVRGGN